MHKILYLTLFFLLNYLSLQAQPGFNEYYAPPDYLGQIFIDGCVVDDTLYVVGSATKNNQQGVVLTELDTNGNMLNRYEYFDSAGYDMGFGVWFDIKILPDEDLIFIASYFHTENQLIFRFDRATKTFTVHDLVFGNAASLLLLDFELYRDGLVCTGPLRDTLNMRSMLLAHTDLEGNIIWEQRINDFAAESYHFSRAVTVLDNDYLLVGALISNNSFVTTRTESLIFITDSMGQVVWHWTTADSLSGSVTDIQQLSDGDLLFLQRIVGSRINNQPQSIWTDAVRMDTTGHVKWRQRISPTDWVGNNAFLMEPSPDGHWLIGESVAFGQYLTNINPGNECACITKITNEGQVLWQTCDSVRVDIPHPMSRRICLRA
jgi:hypothetical protein